MDRGKSNTKKQTFLIVNATFLLMVLICIFSLPPPPVGIIAFMCVITYVAGVSFGMGYRELSEAEKENG